MTTSSKILLFIGFVVTSEGAVGQTVDLSLSAAEELALRNRSELKISSLEEERSIIDDRRRWSSLLPTIDLGRNYVSDQNLIDPNDAHSYNYIKVKGDIVAPSLWFQQKKVSKAKLALSKVETRVVRSKILKQVRTLYFEAKMAKRAWNIALKNSRIADRSQSLAKRKYEKGLAPLSDLKRAELLSRRITKNVITSKRKYEQLLGELYLFIGTPQGSKSITTLSTKVPESYRYFSLNDVQLKKELSKSKNDSLEKMKVRSQIARMSVDNARAEFLPRITMSARFTTSDPRISNPERRSSYLLGVEWNLFSGGKDYYNYRDKIATMKISDEEVYLEKQNFERDLNRIFIELTSLKESYLLEQKNLEDLEFIARESQALFDKGLTNVSVVLRDTEDLVRQESAILDLTLKIISLIAEVSAHSENNGIFDSLL